MIIKIHNTKHCILPTRTTVTNASMVESLVRDLVYNDRQDSLIHFPSGIFQFIKRYCVNGKLVFKGTGIDSGHHSARSTTVWTQNSGLSLNLDHHVIFKGSPDNAISWEVWIS